MSNDSFRCPLKADFDQAVNLGAQLAKVMRKIRRGLADCEVCQNNEQCGLREKFNAEIDGLISEINEEWGMV